VEKNTESQEPRAEKNTESQGPTFDSNRIIANLNQQIANLSFQITLLRMRNEDLEKQLEEAAKNGGEE